MRTLLTFELVQEPPIFRVSCEIKGFLVKAAVINYSLRKKHFLKRLPMLMRICLSISWTNTMNSCFLRSGEWLEDNDIMCWQGKRKLFS